ncbi:MAG: SPOR domain-containing protein [Candidatus Omnitrophota bacterium]
MKKFLIVVVIMAIFLAKVAWGNENLECLETDSLKENYTQVIKNAQDSMSSFPAKELARARYLLGMAYLKTGDYQNARQNFQLVLRGEKDKSLSEEVEIAICDSYYLENNFDEAFTLYEKFLDKHKKSDFKYIVKFKMALTGLKTGDWKTAKRFLKEVSDSPSPDADSAAEILKENQFYFTVQVGSFQDEENARSLARDLKKQGFDSFVAKTRLNDLTFYRVRVGKLDDRKEVDLLTRRLKENGLPAIIYP